MFPAAIAFNNPHWTTLGFCPEGPEVFFVLFCFSVWESTVLHSLDKDIKTVRHLGTWPHVAVARSGFESFPSCWPQFLICEVRTWVSFSSSSNIQRVLVEISPATHVSPFLKLPFLYGHWHPNQGSTATSTTMYDFPSVHWINEQVHSEIRPLEPNLLGVCSDPHRFV